MKCKLLLLLCAVTLAIVTGGSGNLSSHQAVADAKKEKPRPDPGEVEVAKLGKARRDAAEKVYKAWLKKSNNGAGLAAEMPPSSTTYHLSVLWLNAELDLTNKAQERITAYEGHIKRMKHWEEVWESAGAQPGSFVLEMIGAFKKEGEYWLAKERRGKSDFRTRCMSANK